MDQSNPIESLKNDLEKQKEIDINNLLSDNKYMEYYFLFDVS